MLTRDLLIARAIVDLVDNSVDGARRLRPDGNYTGLWVRIELDSDHFRIVDNCGGISVEIARDYAFRFGRPKDAQGTPGPMGQLGVGMKRTFFRLGRYFVVNQQQRCRDSLLKSTWKNGWLRAMQNLPKIGIFSLVS